MDESDWGLGQKELGGEEVEIRNLPAYPSVLGLSHYEQNKDKANKQKSIRIAKRKSTWDA